MECGDHGTTGSSTVAKPAMGNIHNILTIVSQRLKPSNTSKPFKSSGDNFGSMVRFSSSEGAEQPFSLVLWWGTSAGNGDSSFQKKTANIHKNMTLDLN